MRHTKVFGLLALPLLLALTTACGGSKVKIDPNLNDKQVQALLLTEQRMPGGADIETYEVLEAPLSPVMLDNEFKSVRDGINKARLDYQACLTRGLDAAAQNNVEKLEGFANAINTAVSEMGESAKPCIVVLARGQEKSRPAGTLTSVVAYYDPETLAPVVFREVTTPLFNNAVMIGEALNGTLVENTLSGNVDAEALAANSTDPVTRFILLAVPK